MSEEGGEAGSVNLVHQSALRHQERDSETAMTIDEALSALVPQGQLRESLRSAWNEKILPLMDRVLAAAHGPEHVESVVEIAAAIVDGQEGVEADLEALRSSQVIRSLLAIALVFHDLGGVPEPGQRQVEVYPDHEILGAEKALGWMEQHRQAIEQSLEGSEIDFETAKLMVRALILSTNPGVDLPKDSLPLSQNLGRQLEGGRDLLREEEKDKSQVKEFKETVRAILGRYSLGSKPFQAFSRALEVIGAADLGSYLKPVDQLLREAATLYAEFCQGCTGEDGKICFPRPRLGPSEDWLISSFIQNILGRWGKWLPAEQRQNAEAIIALQKQLVGSASVEEFPNDLAEKKRSLAQQPDQVIRAEAALLPDDLVKLAETVRLDLNSTIFIGRQELTLAEAILHFGDEILRSTKSGRGWGPMASEILSQMYAMCARPIDKENFLRKMIELVREKTLSQQPKIQLASGLYLESNPEFLFRLVQLAAADDFQGSLVMTWRADQDGSGQLEQILELCDGEKTTVALGGSLNPESVTAFFEKLNRQEYQGEITVHAGFFADERAVWRQIIDGIKEYLDLGQSDQLDRTVVFHLDRGYQEFLEAMTDDDWMVWRQAAQSGKICFVISPFGELMKGREHLVGLRELLEKCREHGIQVEVTTNNLTLAAGMGRLMQEAVLLILDEEPDDEETGSPKTKAIE